MLALFFLSSAAIADVNALYRAAQKGDLETARSLIANGVDVNARSSLGGSFALNAAAAENDIALLRLLIGSGANANNQAWSGDTALICATKYAGGKTQTVKLLLDAGSDVC